MSIFDGVAGVLNDVFGSPVTITPAGGAAYEITAIFRIEDDVIADGEGGAIVGDVPRLSVQAPASDALKKGDLVAPGDGTIYRLGARHATGSPAPDRFTKFDLEEVGS